MRVINTHAFELHDDFNPYTNHYAILSHRWRNVERNAERTYDTFDPTRLQIDGQLLSTEQRNMPSSEKIELSPSEQKIKGACAAARGKVDRLHWISVDSVCLNKKDPVELNEGIQSMYNTPQILRTYIGAVLRLITYGRFGAAALSQSLAAERLLARRAVQLPLNAWLNDQHGRRHQVKIILRVASEEPLRFKRILCRRIINLPAEKRCKNVTVREMKKGSVLRPEVQL